MGSELPETSLPDHPPPQGLPAWGQMRGDRVQAGQGWMATPAPLTQLSRNQGRRVWAGSPQMQPTLFSATIK